MEKMSSIRREASVGGQSRLAVYSPCEEYRFLLSIAWDESKPWMTVIGLNPSTATELEDDNTVRRCCGFADDLGFGGLRMLNAFAFRSTDPRGMLERNDPVGAGNDPFIAAARGTVVAAWGNHGAHMGRSAAVRKLVRVPMKCWGLTKLKEPRHPLYLPKSAELIDLE